MGLQIRRFRQEEPHGIIWTAGMTIVRLVVKGARSSCSPLAAGNVNRVKVLPPPSSIS